ncbi:aldo/keto reductase [Amycolatopsis alkalitolerans]|uniref:Aldo/keto reductase n=1 Tax=Amycolatopsis alkalitolerans TaxID=2547244 RepID=A0A5C4M8E6_9PSEU|nr:aldo/keto reductase [Amycolatopsis alkalitolerans]TNC29275.1 aldo/keto reductase [Amycolatopsis alkalitolerans]
MPLRRLGRSGLVVSVVGLGTNNLGMKLDFDTSREVVHAALDAGITLFDTADVYGASEERLGEILRGHRDNVVIATKFGSDVRRLGNDNGDDWNARGARRYVRRAVEASLRRLRTDWIDLYQLHRPDALTPIEETLSTLDDLVHEGKVRYLGHSNFTGWQVAHAEWTARQRGFEHFVSAQNEYNLLRRDIEQDVVPALREYGIGLLPYYPLASGLLTGKYRRGADVPEGSRIQAWGLQSVLRDETFDAIEALEAFAGQRELSLLDVAIGGLAAQQAVSSVIAGATSADQVRANVRAVRWQPSAADLADLDALTRKSAG